MEECASKMSLRPLGILATRIMPGAKLLLELTPKAFLRSLLVQRPFASGHREEN